MALDQQVDLLRTSRILRNLVTGNADPRLRADDVTVLTGYLEVVSVPAAQQQGQPAQPQAQPGPPGPPPEISELEAGTKVYRLYNAPDLNDYIEFDKSAILWIEQFDTDVDRLGTTMVWFKQDANVKRMSLEPAQLQLDFFQGRIADKFMSQTTMRELRSTLRQRLLAAGSPGCGGTFGAFSCPPGCPVGPGK